MSVVPERVNLPEPPLAAIERPPSLAATRIRPARVRFVLIVSWIACVLSYLSLVAFGGLMRLIVWTFGLGTWASAVVDLIAQLVELQAYFYRWPLPALWICFFLSWLFRTANNARDLDGAASCPPGAEAVACWLIPLVNLIVPFLHMEAIWRASHGAEKTSVLPHVWWVICLCAVGLAILPGVPMELQASAFAAATLAFLAVVVSIQRAHEARCRET